MISILHVLSISKTYNKFKNRKSQIYEMRTELARQEIKYQKVLNDKSKISKFTLFQFIAKPDL